MHDALAQLRAAFPVRNSWIYFNHAAVCPLPAPAAEAVAAFAREASLDGSTGFPRWLEERERARRLAGSLLGVSADDVAFTTSTSQGLLTVAEGLPFAAGDEILLAENDFPANQIPWFRQERRGARVVVVPRDAEGRITAEAIAARLGKRTRLVAVSWVAYDHGGRLDLARLGRAVREHGALLCVDAIQGLGAFPLDALECGIDFLAADSHKWLLGMEGIGIFYCRRERLESLDPPFIGWLSMQEPFRPYVRGAPLKADARRFEYACLPTAEIFGLRASLELILATGVAAMGAHILDLNARLAAGLAERGWRIISPLRDPGERSGILAAAHPSLPAEAVVAHLEQRGAAVSARCEAVRFSPHAWNSRDEVDALLDRLP